MPLIFPIASMQSAKRVCRYLALIALLLQTGALLAIEPVSKPLYEVKLEKDVVIRVRDNTLLYADIYRPAAEGEFPVLVAYAPYQKDLDEIYPRPVYGWQSREMPEAAFFVPRGYVIARFDVRGVGRSEGKFDLLSEQGAEDAYDVIEWTAQQSWSSGKTSIGGGVGYYSIAPWKAASLNPPHLTAMLSWEKRT
ncbi:CocE/NonD family hydrolase [Pseudomonadota bacterium]